MEDNEGVLVVTCDEDLGAAVSPSAFIFSYEPGTLGGGGLVLAEQKHQQLQVRATASARTSPRQGGDFDVGGIGDFLLFDMNTLREVVYLTQTYKSVFSSSAGRFFAAVNDDDEDDGGNNSTSSVFNQTSPANNVLNYPFYGDGPGFQGPIVAAILAKTRKKILRETILTSVIAIAALLAIFFTLIALLLGRRSRQSQPPHLSTRRYAMVVSLLCSNGLIASRFFGIPVTVWVAEARSLWDNTKVVCAEKMFESAFYAGNISEMLTLCVLAVYHFCYIVPSWPQVNKIRHYISAKYSLVAVWLVSLLLGFADFYTTAIDRGNQEITDASCEVSPISGPSYCMTVSCRDSLTQRAWWAVGLVSLAIMTACYATIFVRIFQTAPAAVAASSTASTAPHRHSLASHHATLSMLCRKRGLVTTIMIFISFVFCSVPYSITEVFLKLTRPRPAEQSTDIMTLLKLITYLQQLILLNCFLDTVIYVVRMPEVKNGYGIMIWEAIYLPVRICRKLRQCFCVHKRRRHRDRGYKVAHLSDRHFHSTSSHNENLMNMQNRDMMAGAINVAGDGPSRSSDHTF